MDDPQIEDEKKPFDVDNATHDDAQPDPDESLMMDTGNGRIWLVKIPKFLMERWTSINEDGVELATIRIYNSAISASTGRIPRIMLHLPPNPDTPDIPGDVYELDMVNDKVKNQIVVAEREKHPGTASRARTTVLTGRVKHDLQMRPTFSEKYRQRLRERSRAANTSSRSIQYIENAHPGGRGGINMLTSGVANAGSFSDLVRPKPKLQKGQFERMARMPRNQLLDMLFGCFREKEYWSIKLLRERTQQPEVYLKEVLNEIAFLHRSGEHNGTWELMANFKGEGIKGENVPGPSLVGESAETKVEDDEDDEDDDEDEDDMEEVS